MDVAGALVDVVAVDVAVEVETEALLTELALEMIPPSTTVGVLLVLVPMAAER